MIRYSAKGRFLMTRHYPDDVGWYWSGFLLLLKGFWLGSSRHPTILLSHHPAIPPSHHPAIPLSCYRVMVPSHHSAIHCCNSHIRYRWCSPVTTVWWRDRARRRFPSLSHQNLRPIKSQSLFLSHSWSWPSGWRIATIQQCLQLNAKL